jgi:hypothetical protein
MAIVPSSTDIYNRKKRKKDFTEPRIVLLPQFFRQYQQKGEHFIILFELLKYITMCQTASLTPPSSVMNDRNPNSRSKPLSSRSNIPNYQLVPIWILITLASEQLSIFFPTNHSELGRKIFVPARYQYDAINTRFDNTIWTWGTDYAIGILMIIMALKCLFKNFTFNNQENSSSKRDSSTKMRNRGAALFLCYVASVFAGGIAHQTYKTLESLNTTSFRCIWTICVGTVTFGGAFMGMIGTEICRKFNNKTTSNNVYCYMPPIPDFLWLFYGAYMTYICIKGDISYKRPACDIFAAGTSQFLPTVYNILVLLSIKWQNGSANTDNNNDTNNYNILTNVKKSGLILYIVGFVGNAPLLPAYPLLVQHSGLSLGMVNTVLHINLTYAWSCQALSVLHFCKALEQNQTEMAMIENGNMNGEENDLSKAKTL